MKCPFCGHTETAVLESRIQGEGNSFRRRRECTKCQKRFTTYERIEGPSLLVIKKDGRREAFDAEKLRRGLLRSFEKRQVPLKRIKEIAEEIERELLKRDTIEIPSKFIGNATLKRLKKIDKVAWLRFASVYLEFADLTDFEKAIEKEEK